MSPWSLLPLQVRLPLTQHPKLREKLMTRYFNEQDVKVETLKGQKVTVAGYGSQAARALNLRDSGVNVTVALRTGGKSWAAATKDGSEGSCECG